MVDRVTTEPKFLLPLKFSKWSKLLQIISDDVTYYHRVCMNSPGDNDGVLDDYGGITLGDDFGFKFKATWL